MLPDLATAAIENRNLVLEPLTVDAPALVDAVRLAVGHDEASALHGKRAESLRALSELVVSLGYPASWATELERRAFSAGRVWQRMR